MIRVFVVDDHPVLRSAVVLYTAVDAASTGTEALEAGAHAVVEKAAGIDVLFDAIRLAARAATE